MLRIMNTTVLDHVEAASGEKDMSNKPSVTGLCAMCCHGDLHLGEHGRAREGPPENAGFCLCFHMREGEREKKHPLLVKSSHCTERYRVKVTHIFHLFFLSSS